MTRLQKIGQKMDQNRIALINAKKGIASANRNNPFWNKSQAMKHFNQVKKMQNQLSKIWVLELLTMNLDFDDTIPF